MVDNGTGDEVYQPDGDAGIQEDTGLLDLEDTLDDRGVAVALDEGYSAPERPWGAESWGTTAEEQGGHEALGDRLAHELPEVTVREGDGLGDLLGQDGELRDAEVGAERSGRLTRWDTEGYPGGEPGLFASDVGIDGAAASAEEAAVHVIPDYPDPDGDI
jgi:hypothetical protein